MQKKYNKFLNENYQQMNLKQKLFLLLKHYQEYKEVNMSILRTCSPSESNFLLEKMRVFSHLQTEFVYMQELETIINRNEYFKDFLNYQNNMLLNTFNLIFEIFEKIKECNYKKDDIVKTEKGIKATVKLLKKIHKNTIEKQLNGLECKKGCEEDIKSTEERITKLKQSLDIPISDLVEENKT